MFVLKLKVFPIINNLVLFSRAGFLKVGVAHTDLIMPKGRDLARLFCPQDFELLVCLH